MCGYGRLSLVVSVSRVVVWVWCVLFGGRLVERVVLLFLGEFVEGCGFSVMWWVVRLWCWVFSCFCLCVSVVLLVMVVSVSSMVRVVG